MRYLVTQIVEVEAESLTKAAEIAEQPIVQEMRRQSTRLAGIVSMEPVEIAKVRSA
jgi:hypothetical protein